LELARDSKLFLGFIVKIRVVSGAPAATEIFAVNIFVFVYNLFINAQLFWLLDICKKKNH
jgi:hypothetical protein